MKSANVRIAAAAYTLPPGSVSVEEVMEAEKERIEAALRPVSPSLRARVVEGLGMKRVRVCGEKQPYDLALEAVATALAEATVRPRDLDLIIDFSTLPGDSGEYLSFAQKLSADLGAETSLNFSFKVGGCGGLHLALKNALALMAADESLRTAVLVAADSPPPGSRSILPVTIQGDAGSAVVLRRDASQGPELLVTEVLTLSHLHDAITVTRSANGARDLVINVDSARIENDLMPIYYLNFHRLVHKALDKASLKLEDIHHFFYSNISRTDREGFRRTFGLRGSSDSTRQLEEYGHTFASDLVINYTDARREDLIRPGELLLFASAGIGFTWGVTLARA